MIADFKTLPISGHAHAIGHLCIAWSSLESLTDLFLTVLLKMGRPDVNSAVIHNADTREKWQMIISVGFLKQINTDWYGRLLSLMNHIDNDLRPERNRMVHDRWDYSQATIKRFRPIARVLKIQSRELAFRDGESKPISEEDVWVLAITVMAAFGELIELLEEYTEHDTRPLPDIAE